MSNIDTQLDKLLADMPEHNRISEHELLKSQILQLINEARIEAFEKIWRRSQKEGEKSAVSYAKRQVMRAKPDLTNRGKE